MAVLGRVSFSGSFIHCKFALLGGHLLCTNLTFGRYSFLPLHALLYLIFPSPLSYCCFLCFFMVGFLEFLVLGSSFMAFFSSYIFSFSAFRVKSGRGEADHLCDHAGPDRASTPIPFLFFIFCSVCTYIRGWRKPQGRGPQKGT